jgi:AcrR family transcriptional regulator
MRDGDVTKDRIGRAAMRLFVENGIAETSMREIAKASAITEGAIYRHFASKEELAAELFATSYESFAQELEAARATAPELHDQLGAMIGKFYAYFDDDPIRFSYLLLTQHFGLKKVSAGTVTPVSLLRATIAKAIARGDIPKQDADVATAIVLGIVLQTAVSKVYGHIRQNLTGLAPQISAACWAALTHKSL